jgi:hypothetical protein
MSILRVTDGDFRSLFPETLSNHDTIATDSPESLTPRPPELGHCQSPTSL